MGPDDDPKTIVAAGYDAVAKAYGELEGDSAWPRMRWLRKVTADLEPGATVLDLGCGAGDPADAALAKDHRVVGVDISRVQLRLAHHSIPQATFIRADAGTVGFAAESFDAVVSFYMLEHLPREEHRALIARIARWLRPGGHFLLSTEAGELEDTVGTWLSVPMFFSAYDPATVRSIIEAGGFDLLETAIELQIEQETEIPYLWVLARKRGRA
jgi:cyclopropane fatty-acyl-phospholipid synthase-like methyltransferase